MKSTIHTSILHNVFTYAQKDFRFKEGTDIDAPDLVLSGRHLLQVLDELPLVHLEILKRGETIKWHF